MQLENFNKEQISEVRDLDIKVTERDLGSTRQNFGLISN